MERILQTALKRILKDCPRKEKDLREHATNALDALQKRAGSASRGGGEMHPAFFEPLRLAIGSKNARVKATALDCTQQLISLGHMRGEGSQRTGKEAQKRFVDTVIDALCSCREDPVDEIQHAMINTLLVAITSNVFEVHGESLLKSIQACYHIYLVSKNQVNRNNAKTVLAQMMNVIFQRMEIAEKKRGEQVDSATSRFALPTGAAADPRAGASASPDEQQELHEKEAMDTEGPEAPEEAEYVSEAKDDDSDGGRPQGAQTLQESDRAAQQVALSAAWNGVAGTTIYAGVVQALGFGVESSSAGREKGHSMGGTAEELDDTPASKNGGTGGAKEEAPNGSTGGGDGSPLSGAGSTKEGDAEDDSGSHASAAHRDAYLVFRALCKLAMRGSAEDDASSGAADPIAVMSKTLSLELLRHILDKSGPTLQTPKFISLIKKYLCDALLKNYVSSRQHVVTVSLKIFVSLIRHFKHELHTQMEVFISSIFLRILKSTHASFEQRLAVLEVFLTMCKDATILVELFLNFDCNDTFGSSSDLFESIVRTLGGIVQRQENQTHSTKAAAEIRRIRFLALQCLSALVHSLSDYLDALEGAATSAVADAGLQGNVTAGPAGDGARGSIGGSNELEENIEEDDNMSDSGSATVSTVAGASGLSLAEAHERKKKTQQELARAAVRFARKPSDGLKYLVSIGRCTMEPSSVAAVFHELKDVLDKTAIGDYMGEDKQFHKEVLYAYVDQMDFTGTSFDGGIRKFLSGFRIPGEAQKIDRMMEKFAERYCENNPSVFPSADTAFILAYSVIMLNTDAHNPSIKEDRRMKKSDFIRNNRGIAAGQDLPEDFLSAIYDSIVRNAITLREDDALRERETTTSSRKQSSKLRASLFIKEKEDILREVNKLKQDAEANDSSQAHYYVSAQDAGIGSEHLRQMFQVVWGPLLAGLSVTLETAEDGQWVSLCLSGFIKAVHISGSLGMSVECHAFVTALAKFTFLDGLHQAGLPVRRKHVACIRALLLVATKEGNNLQGAWSPILSLLSQLARLQLFVSGGLSDEDLFLETFTVGDHRHADAHRRKSAAQRRHISSQSLEMERQNAYNILQAVGEMSIDRVYTNSVKLEGEAIVDFVRQLCDVSRQEVRAAASQGETSAPRIFSLQKVVEVADYNMACRPRVVWARMWNILSNYFTELGTQTNEHIAAVAIDSLKQLSMKFLEKDELRSFSFQSMFLQSFQRIMTANPSLFVRDLVLRVCANMILARVTHIKSGWKALLGVIAVAASDANPGIVTLAFDTVSGVIRQHFELLAPYFPHVINTLLAFAKNNHEMVSLRAIDLLTMATGYLAQGHVRVEGDSSAPRSSSSGAGGKEESKAAAASEDEWIVVQLQEASPVKAPRGRVVRTAPEAAAVADITGEESPSGTPKDSDEAQALDSGSDVEDGSSGPAQPLHSNGAVTGQGAAGSAGEALRIRRFRDIEEHIRVWWPVLVGLATLIGDRREQVRTSAMTELFNILRRYGAGFNDGLWVLLYRGVLLPLFDDVAHTADLPVSPNGTSPHDALQSPLESAKARAREGALDATEASAVVQDVEWLRTTCKPALSSLVRLHIRFFHRLEFLLPDLLGLLERTIDQEIEGLARIGLACLEILLSEAGAFFDAATWGRVVACLQRLFEKNTPYDLMRAKEVLVGVAADAAYLGYGGEEGKGEEASPLEAGVEVQTPYGKGIVVQHDAGGGSKVQLPWGMASFPASEDLAVTSLPKASAPKAMPFNTSRVVTQCVVQLELINCVGVLASAHLKTLPAKELLMIVNMLERAADFARAFNNDHQLRQALWRADFMKLKRHGPNRLPSLLRQESNSSGMLLVLLLKLIQPQDAGNASSELQQRLSVAIDKLKSLSKRMVARYLVIDDHLDAVRRAKDAAANASAGKKERAAAAVDAARASLSKVATSEGELYREREAYGPLIVTLLKGCLSMTREQFFGVFGWLYPLLTDLIQCGSHDVRHYLRKVFSERVEEAFTSSVAESIRKEQQ